MSIAQDDVDLWDKLVSTGVFSTEKVGIKNATPAKILQSILEKQWSLNPQDRDMIVMWHKVVYQKNGQEHQVESSLVCEGENQKHTAMAKTVGLPLAIACKLILTNKVDIKGCILPVLPAFYNPILVELEAHGIVFKEKIIS